MSKKFTKEELERDPLLDFYVKSSNYFVANRVTILSIAVTLLVVVAVFIGYGFYSSDQEAKAQNLLAIAEVEYSQGDYLKALKGDEFELTLGFEQIADNYSGTDAGNLASYYAAVSNFKLGNTLEALAYMQEFKPADGIMGVGAVSFHASLLEANESLEKAARMYEKAAEWDVNDSTTPYNLFKAANIYFEMGELEKAKELAETIVKEYPNSLEVAESQQLQGRIAIATG